MEEESTEKRTTLLFFVNGHKVEDPDADPSVTLISYLRHRLRLCGTKLGCGEGGCGSCTVMVSFAREEQNGSVQVKHISVNACLVPVVAIHGMAVTTVEGIGSTRTRLHAVQQRIADTHGSQCGFCTPGIVMSMYTLLRNNPKPAMTDVETYMQGNLCRCTGYRPILDAFKTLTVDGQLQQVQDRWAGIDNAGQCPKTADGTCCQLRSSENISKEEDATVPNLVDGRRFRPYDPTQEPIFPPELILTHKSLLSEVATFRGSGVTWYRPTSLTQLLALKKLHPHAKIVVGNTELGIETKFKGCHYPIMIQATTQIPEMTTVELGEGYVSVGAAVTFSELEDALAEIVKRLQPHETRILTEMIRMLHWFAGKQIRNVASLGGNLATASPISDFSQILLAARSQVRLVDVNRGTTSSITMDESFFTGYRRTVMKSEEVLLSINVPLTTEAQHFKAYKQSRRREDDIAIVNAAFFFDVTDAGVIQEARMAFGGMGPTTKMALKTSHVLVGQAWDRNVFEKAFDALIQDLPLLPNAPGGMIRYRQSLAVSLLLKAFLSISMDTGLCPVAPSEQSGAHHLVAESRHPRSRQFFELSNAALRPVGLPVKHRSADKQSTGEAVYVDDIPPYDNELHLAFVLSCHAHARILSIDSSAAEAALGFRAFFSAKDLPEECNRHQTGTAADEVVFALDVVESVGQIIGAVVASTPEAALQAANLVVVEYEVLPAILTIEEAIAANSFYDWEIGTICRGRPDAALRESDHVIEGSMKTEAQEHFYIEPQACVAVPREEKEMKLYASTQDPTGAQRCVAHALGWPMHQVTVATKRLGGGFGGKETRCMSMVMACAVAAERLRRPVRVVLDREADMLVTGHRHPFLGKYKVGFNEDGRINALDLQLFNNAGRTVDLSTVVMHRAIFNGSGAYNIPNLRVRGRSCKTNVQSNTAFRAFGVPQCFIVVETFIDEIASCLKKNPIDVRRLNLYSKGDVTFYNHEIPDWSVRRCFEDCVKQSKVDQQQKAIATFNSLNRWKKRGLSMVALNFGLAFSNVMFNQGGALVHVYTDGSVLVSHGGVEMGQGLHTKMAQVAAQALGVPMDLILVADTVTDKVPNASPTAASLGSDFYGAAVLDACNTINGRLEKVRQEEDAADLPWRDLIQKAYKSMKSLSATGFYNVTGLGYDDATNTGRVFNYFTSGAACSVVEVDCLTGDHRVLAVDIVMDVGKSLNPAIDIGQIEGGFVQGYGMFTLEQLVHSPLDGSLLTRGPGTYKIPAFGDAPSHLNVTLLSDSANDRAIHSSRGLGEPPLVLASSVYFAVKEAVRAARSDANLKPHFFQLGCPATAERIRMACEDDVTDRVGSQPPVAGSFIPWGIHV